MHAAVVEQFREPLVLREWDIPAPGVGQILVKTEACGVCHTDPRAAHGDWPVKPDGVLITAPSLGAFKQGVGMTRKRGMCVLVGLPPGEFPAPLFDVVANCITGLRPARAGKVASPRGPGVHNGLSRKRSGPFRTLAGRPDALQPMTFQPPSVLTLNGGSSSIRFAVYEAGDTLRRRLDGKIDRIGASEATFIVNDPVGTPQAVRTLAAADRGMTAGALLDWLDAQPIFASVTAAGDRVVHGMQHKFTLDAPEKNIRRNPSGRRANLRPTQRNRPRRS